MAIREVECDICGNPFTTTSPVKKYCSTECCKLAEKYKKDIRLNRNGRVSMKRYTQRSNLTQEIEAAKRLGMSYGQYKAMKYLKEMSDENRSIRV